MHFLTSLSAVLDKAAALCEAKKIEPSVLLNTRLAPNTSAGAAGARATKPITPSTPAEGLPARDAKLSNYELDHSRFKERIARPSSSSRA